MNAKLIWTENTSTTDFFIVIYAKHKQTRSNMQNRNCLSTYMYIIIIIINCKCMLYDYYNE